MAKQRLLFQDGVPGWVTDAVVEVAALLTKRKVPKPALRVAVEPALEAINNVDRRAVKRTVKKAKKAVAKKTTKKAKK